MENIYMGDYDIIVIGSGHAGCEAALAAARMGHKILMFSMNLESIAMMPCNPSIGGTGTGHYRDMMEVYERLRGVFYV